MFVFLWFLVLSTHPVDSTTSDCDLTVNISNGVQHGPNITWDSLTFTEMDYFTNESGIFGCVCRVDSCIQDCCQSGFYMDANASNLSCIPQQNQAYTNLNGVNVNNIVHVNNKNICSEEQTRIKLNASDENLDVQLVDKGSLLWAGVIYDFTDFCVSTVDQTVLVALCVVPDSFMEKITNYIGNSQNVSVKFRERMIDEQFRLTGNCEGVA